MRLLALLCPLWLAGCAELDCKPSLMPIMIIFDAEEPVLRIDGVMASINCAN